MKHTREEFERLPLLVDLSTAAEWLGVSRDTVERKHALRPCPLTGRRRLPRPTLAKLIGKPEWE